MGGRPKPSEEAVRDQLRREEELVADESAVGSRQGAEEDDSRQSTVDTPASQGTGSPESEAPPADEDPLQALQRDRDEYLALAQRTQADFENYRKRAARDAAQAGERARSGVVSELLPVVDNLERALASAGEAEEHLVDGVRLVHSELLALLERNGVEQFDPAGERFDPTYHEALSTRPAEDAEPGLVVDVVEKGYRTDGSVLRPARVVVSG